MAGPGTPWSLRPHLNQVRILGDCAACMSSPGQKTHIHMVHGEGRGQYCVPAAPGVTMKKDAEVCPPAARQCH
jgi:hypothetical protein